jgi:hypothetical protein
MKAYGILFIFFLQVLALHAQNQYGRQPYPYNAFVQRADISWACESYNTWSFDEKKSGKDLSIHQYLVNAQKSGVVKSYLNNDFAADEISKWKKKTVKDYYVEVDKKYNDQRLTDFDNSTSLVEFHEIFYLQHYQLKSQVVSAAPQLKVFSSSGLYIGNTITSFSSVHYGLAQKQNKNDKIIFLGSTDKTFSFDSLEITLGLKKSYNMNVSLALWYGLSKGLNKVVDLKTSKLIPPAAIMNYAAFDSVDAASNTDTLSVANRIITGAPAYNYFSDITLLQDWYYNKTKDFFYTRIRKAFLHITYFDSKEFIYKNEKRFEISF